MFRPVTCVGMFRVRVQGFKGRGFQGLWFRVTIRVQEVVFSKASGFRVSVLQGLFAARAPGRFPLGFRV